MTLPIFLAAHLVYGAFMARILLRRMRAEGEVLGVPLVVTLVPICIGTAPLGGVLLRYAGAWFLHGALIGDGSVAYERFHLGLMIATGISAGICTVAAMFWVLAVVTRDKGPWGHAPYALAGLVTLLTLILDGRDVLQVPGTNGRWLFLHPAGLVSLAIVAVLVAGTMYARARTANVMPRPTGPASVVPLPQ
jgi:hypothetical protein